jgi:hypothetical protein
VLRDSRHDVAPVWVPGMSIVTSITLLLRDLSHVWENS